MADEIDIDDVGIEDEANTTFAPAANHCPFGCMGEDVDERGYCRHLIGFTNNKKIMEPLVPIMRQDRDAEGHKIGEPLPTGNYKVLGRKGQTRPVPPKAKLVNPEERQFVGGIWHLAKKWVSWRVYVKNPEETTSKAG